MTSTVLPAADRSARGARHLLDRLLDGGHPWGSLAVSMADRTGSTRYVLTVFPPGITTEQRHALVFHRRWIVAGAPVWFIVSAALSIVMNGWAAIAIGGAIYFGALLAANARTGEARRRVVEVRAALVNLLGHREAFGSVEILQDAVTRLVELDELAAAGTLSAVQYELRWGAIYRDIVEEQAASAKRR